MHRIFGRAKQETPAAPPPDLQKHVQGLTDQEKHLNEQISGIDLQLMQLKQQMTGKPQAVQHLRSQAAFLIKRKNMYIQQRGATQTRAFSLEQAQFALQTVQGVKEQAAVMKHTAGQLQSAQAEVNLDELEDLYEDMQESMYNVEEINEVMSRDFSIAGDVNEADLDAELLGLDAQMASLPDSLPATAQATRASAAPAGGYGGMDADLASLDAGGAGAWRAPIVPVGGFPSEPEQQKTAAGYQRMKGPTMEAISGPAPPITKVCFLKAKSSQRNISQRGTAHRNAASLTQHDSSTVSTKYQREARVPHAVAAREASEQALSGLVSTQQALLQLEKLKETGQLNLKTYRGDTFGSGGEYSEGHAYLSRRRSFDGATHGFGSSMKGALELSKEAAAAATAAYTAELLAAKKERSPKVHDPEPSENVSSNVRRALGLKRAMTWEEDDEPANADDLTKGNPFLKGFKPLFEQVREAQRAAGIDLAALPGQQAQSHPATALASPTVKKGLVAAASRKNLVGNASTLDDGTSSIVDSLSGPASEMVSVIAAPAWFTDSIQPQLVRAMQLNAFLGIHVESMPADEAVEPFTPDRFGAARTMSLSTIETKQQQFAMQAKASKYRIVPGETGALGHVPTADRMQMGTPGSNASRDHSASMQEGALVIGQDRMMLAGGTFKVATNSFKVVSKGSDVPADKMSSTPEAALIVATERSHGQFPDSGFSCVQTVSEEGLSSRTIDEDLLESTARSAPVRASRGEDVHFHALGDYTSDGDTVDIPEDEILDQLAEELQQKVSGAGQVAITATPAPSTTVRFEIRKLPLSVLSAEASQDEGSIDWYASNPSVTTESQLPSVTSSPIQPKSAVIGRRSSQTSVGRSAFSGSRPTLVFARHSGAAHDEKTLARTINTATGGYERWAAAGLDGGDLRQFEAKVRRNEVFKRLTSPLPSIAKNTSVFMEERMSVSGGGGSVLSKKSSGPREGQLGGSKSRVSRSISPATSSPVTAKRSEPGYPAFPDTVPLQESVSRHSRRKSTTSPLSRQSRSPARLSGPLMWNASPEASRAHERKGNASPAYGTASAYPAWDQPLAQADPNRPQYVAVDATLRSEGRPETAVYDSQGTVSVASYTPYFDSSLSPAPNLPGDFNDGSAPEERFAGSMPPSRTSSVPLAESNGMDAAAASMVKSAMDKVNATASSYVRKVASAHGSQDGAARLPVSFSPVASIPPVDTGGREPAVPPSGRNSVIEESTLDPLRAVTTAAYTRMQDTFRNLAEAYLTRVSDLRSRSVTATPSSDITVERVLPSVAAAGSLIDTVLPHMRAAAGRLPYTSTSGGAQQPRPGIDYAANYSSTRFSTPTFMSGVSEMGSIMSGYGGQSAAPATQTALPQDWDSAQRLRPGTSMRSAYSPHDIHSEQPSHIFEEISYAEASDAAEATTQGQYRSQGGRSPLASHGAGVTPVSAPAPSGYVPIFGSMVSTGVATLSAMEPRVGTAHVASHRKVDNSASRKGASRLGSRNQAQRRPSGRAITAATAKRAQSWDRFGSSGGLEAFLASVSMALEVQGLGVADTAPVRAATSTEWAPIAGGGMSLLQQLASKGPVGHTTLVRTLPESPIKGENLAKLPSGTKARVRMTSSRATTASSPSKRAGAEALAHAGLVSAQTQTALQEAAQLATALLANAAPVGKKRASFPAGPALRTPLVMKSPQTGGNLADEYYVPLSAPKPITPQSSIAAAQRIEAQGSAIKPFDEADSKLDGDYVDEMVSAFTHVPSSKPGSSHGSRPISVQGARPISMQGSRPISVHGSRPMSMGGPKYVGAAESGFYPADFSEDRPTTGSSIGTVESKRGLGPAAGTGVRAVRAMQNADSTWLDSSDIEDETTPVGDVQPMHLELTGWPPVEQFTEPNGMSTSTEQAELYDMDYAALLRSGEEVSYHNDSEDRKEPVTVLEVVVEAGLSSRLGTVAESFANDAKPVTEPAEELDAQAHENYYAACTN